MLGVRVSDHSDPVISSVRAIIASPFCRLEKRVARAVGNDSTVEVDNRLLLDLRFQPLWDLYVLCGEKFLPH